MALSRSLLGRIRDLAAIARYKVAIGDGQLLSTAEYWWSTLRFSKNANVSVARPDGPKLMRILQATKSGVYANLVLSITLKCDILEATKDAKSKYYGWNEASPARPDDETQWTVSPTIMAGFIVGIGVEVGPPAKVGTSVQPDFKPCTEDKPSDVLSNELDKLDID